jgi:hypothetical protein
MNEIENNYSNLLWKLAEATQHRNAISDLHRNNPSRATLEWRNEANVEVRKLQRQMQRVAKTLAKSMSEGGGSF